MAQDESSLKLAATKYEVSNFDSRTGQKLFQPVINNQHLQNTPATATPNNNWRANAHTTTGDLAINGNPVDPNASGIIDQSVSLSINESALFQTETSTASDDENTLDQILGNENTMNNNNNISTALYNDAFDRRERQQQMNDWTHQKIDDSCKLGLNNRSPMHAEKTNYLASRKLERDIMSAFRIITSAKTEHDEEEVLTEDDVMRNLKLFKEHHLIDRR